MVYDIIYIGLGHTHVKYRPCVAPLFCQFYSGILVQGHNNATAGIAFHAGQHSGWITWTKYFNNMENYSFVNVLLWFNMENSGSGMENTQVTYRKKSPSQVARDSNRFTEWQAKKAESNGAEAVPSVIISQVDSKKVGEENDINLSRYSNGGQSKQDIVSVHFNNFYCMGICDKLTRHLSMLTYIYLNVDEC